MSACKVMCFFGKPLSFLQCRSPARLPCTDVYNMMWAAPPDGMPGGCVPDTKLPARRLNSLSTARKVYSQLSYVHSQLANVHTKLSFIYSQLANIVYVPPSGSLPAVQQRFVCRAGGFKGRAMGMVSK